MADFSPLTKEERERLVTDNEKALAECAKMGWEIDWATRDLIRYEATVAALEAEIARLREKAEVGEAVEAMGIGDDLERGSEMAWTLTRRIPGCRLAGHWHGDTALAALRGAFSKAVGASDG